MDIFAQIILFFAVVVLMVNILISLLGSYEFKLAIQRRLEIEDNKDKKAFFINILDLFYPINHLILSSKFFKKEEMEGKMFTARLFIVPEHFFAVKELMVFLFLLLSFLFVKKGDVLPLIMFPFLGFILPDVWLNIKIKQRRAQVIRTLPDTVDLLSLCVDAGLDFIAAARWIVDKSKPNAFLEELGLVLHEIKVGKSRRESLKAMARRLNLPDVTAFCRTLIQADRMGIPIAEALAVLSDDTRDRFFRRVERKALQAPMKMLIPLIFFILPVVAIIVGGPVLLQFMSGSLGGLKGLK